MPAWTCAPLQVQGPAKRAYSDNRYQVACLLLVFALHSVRIAAAMRHGDRPGAEPAKQLSIIGAINRMVGAAGFEPTTCSTQNCRATRLRYTPII
jgi:hypothetical protein